MDGLKNAMRTWVVGISEYSLWLDAKISPLMNTAAKSCLTLFVKSFRQNHFIFVKIFQGEMLFRASATTLLETFCKIILFEIYSQKKQIQMTITGGTLKH